MTGPALLTDREGGGDDQVIISARFAQGLAMPQFRADTPVAPSPQA
jgi:hypothetical protein